MKSNLSLIRKGWLTAGIPVARVVLYIIDKTYLPRRMT
jgi:hypothetical protein